MSVESVILQGRRFQETQFVSRCIIRRQSGETFNDITGEYEPAFVTVYGGTAGGPCLLKFPGMSLREVDAQSQQLVRQQIILKLPVQGTDGVKVGDVAEIVENPLDQARVGLKVRVTGDHAGSLTTARRLPVEVVSGV